MGSKYSIFFLAAISLTASAEWVDPSNTLGLASVIANNLVKGVPATDSYYSPKSGRNSVDSKRPDTHGLDNKPLEGDRNQTVFGYTIGGGSGSYSASAVGFGSTSSSGGGGQVNLGGGAQSDLNPANQIGGGNTISRGVASASNSGSGYSDGVSPSYNNGSNTSVPGVNFPPATTTSSNSANQIGGTPEPSTINTQSTTQNLGSQTPTFETLFKPGTNNLPTVSAPKTPITNSFETNMANAGVTTNIPSNIGNLVGNSSPNLFASILPGDSSGGKSSSSKTKDTFTDAVQSAPSTPTGYSTPFIIASNSPSQEAPVTATNPTSTSPTSTTPSSTSSTPSSSTTAGTSTTSTPPSSTSTTSGTTSSATTTSASNSGGTPSATGTPTSTTHAGGATLAVAPTTGTPVVTASNSTTPAPESTTGGANLSSTGSGTAAPENQQGSPGGLRTFDPTLPGGINKLSLNSNDFKVDKINGASAVSNGDTVKTCIDKLNSYINSSTFTRSVDPTRNTVLNCVDSSSFNYLTNQSNFYKKLEEYYNKECIKIKDNPDFISVMKLNTQSGTYLYKLKEFKEKYSPNSESGQLYVNRCANIYRLLDKYNKFKEVEETYTNEDSKTKSSVAPHSSPVTPVKTPSNPYINE